MKIYCSGIGGIGLSAYAALQQAAGHTVAGSDRTDSPLLKDLATQGIAISLNQDSSALPTDTDLFVYSEAVPADAPERVRAQKLGIRSISYFQALGELSEPYQVIAVCGTHGKSTTTAMLAKALIEAGLDPSVVVGTLTPDLAGRNWRRGASNFFLVEACEYRRSFHFLSPTIVVMTNVGGDHFDFFKTDAEYQNSYLEFLDRLPANGKVITHGKDPATRSLAEQSGREWINADSEPLLPLKVPGVHMQQNAQLALATAVLLGADRAAAEQSLRAFVGTWRRSELKGEYKGVPVIDDYAHHPDEIRATLLAFRQKYPTERLVCVFQPHTHDRTLKLYDQFVESFADADVVIIPNVYDARHDIETNLVDVPKFVSDIATRSNVEAIDGHSLADTESVLRTSMLREGDVLLCLGAGDITNLANSLTR